MLYAFAVYEYPSTYVFLASLQWRKYFIEYVKENLDKKISILKVSIYYILNKNQLILELQKHLKMNSLKKFSKFWFFKAQYCSLTHLLILLVYFVKVASTYSRKCWLC